MQVDLGRGNYMEKKTRNDRVVPMLMELTPCLHHARMQVYKSSVAHWYSISRARHELGWQPMPHDFSEVVASYSAFAAATATATAPMATKRLGTATTAAAATSEAVAAVAARAARSATDTLAGGSGAWLLPPIQQIAIPALLVLVMAMLLAAFLATAAPPLSSNSSACF